MQRDSKTWAAYLRAPATLFENRSSSRYPVWPARLLGVLFTLIFATAAHAWSESTGANLGHAVLFCILEQLPDICPEMAGLVAGARAGEVRVPTTPEGHWLAELARRLFGPRGPKLTRAGLA